MPRDLNSATIVNRISNDAKFACDDYRLSLREIGITRTDQEVWERITSALVMEHIYLLLEYAFLNLSEAQLKSSKDYQHSYVVNATTHLYFDKFVHRLRKQKPRMVKHNYQVVQGLHLLLELPYIRDLLLPLMPDETVYDL